MSTEEHDRPTLSNRRRVGRWQVEFPYGWDADDLVSRRHLLRWAVWASGAFFAATGVLAGLGYTRSRTVRKTQAIVQASAVPRGGVHYFNYPEAGDEALLLHLDDGSFVAYAGKCTHLSCAVYWDAAAGKIACPCHNGSFDPRTGEVLAGPPPRPLAPITLREKGGMLYAIEETAG